MLWSDCCNPSTGLGYNLILLDSLCDSRGPFSDAIDQPAVWIAVSMRAEWALSDWISVNGRLCVVRSKGSIRVKSGRLKGGCLLILALHKPIDCKCSQTEDEFYREPS